MKKSEIREKDGHCCQPPLFLTWAAAVTSAIPATRALVVPEANGGEDDDDDDAPLAVAESEKDYQQNPEPMKATET